jgi:hypothetical protein
MDHPSSTCTSRQHKGTAWRPGYELNKGLRPAIALAGDAGSAATWTIEHRETLAS